MIKTTFFVVAALVSLVFFSSTSQEANALIVYKNKTFCHYTWAKGNVCQVFRVAFVVPDSHFLPPPPPPPPPCVPSKYVHCAPPPPPPPPPHIPPPPPVITHHFTYKTFCHQTWYKGTQCATYRILV